MEEEWVRATQVANSIWAMVHEELARDGSLDAGGQEPLVQPAHQAPVQPDHHAAESLYDRYLEELAEDFLEKHGGSLTKATSALFGDGSKSHPASADEPGDSTRPAAAGSALMNASSRASEDTPIPPPHRDQDPPDFVDGAGGSAGQAHALLDGCWTEEHDSFLQGMVAYGGRHDWAGKTAVLNQNFAESFTLRQVFQRCKELDARAASSKSSSGTPAPRKVSAASSSSSLGKMPWTTEEDEILLAEGKRVRCDWRKVATLLPGRSAKALQCRFGIICSQASPEPSSPKPKETVAITAKAKDDTTIAMSASSAKQASKVPSSLAQQSKGRKQKETGDSRNAFARPPRPRTGRGTKRNVENFGTEKSQQAKIPAMVSSTGRTYRHSLFLRTMPPPPPQQQQQQQQGTQ